MPGPDLTFDYLENGATKILNRSYGRTDKTNIDQIYDALAPNMSETFTYNDAGRLSGATSTVAYARNLGLMTPMATGRARPPVACSRPTPTRQPPTS
jgi:hypothetical protein